MHSPILKLEEDKVVRMRLGLGCERCTLEKTAREFDVSAERIRQHEQEAMRKLYLDSVQMEDLRSAKKAVLAEAVRLVRRLSLGENDKLPQALARLESLGWDPKN